MRGTQRLERSKKGLYRQILFSEKLISLLSLLTDLQCGRKRCSTFPSEIIECKIEFFYVLRCLSNNAQNLNFNLFSISNLHKLRNRFAADISDFVVA